MAHCFSLICLGIVLLLGCPLKHSAARTRASKQMPAGQVASTGTLLASDCPVTQPIEAEPPKDPNADRFGYRLWYVNADRTIWVRSFPGQAGRGEKVIWIRPRGTQLKVSGRRLDAKAPPLKVGIPCCYPTGFQVSGTRFPTEGCWEVRARAGASQLRFVTRVAPAR